MQIAKWHTLFFEGLSTENKWVKTRVFTIRFRMFFLGGMKKEEFAEEYSTIAD